MIDSDLLLRSDATHISGSCSATNLTGVDFGGADKAPMTYVVSIPTVTGGSPTLDVKIQESDNDSTYRDFMAFPQITAAGQYFVTGQSNARYRRAVITVGGTTPVFQSTLIAPVPAGRYTNY